MEKEELRQVALLESNTVLDAEDRISIELSPRYQDVNEDIPEGVDRDHESFFQWKRDEGQTTIISNFLQQNTTHAILVRLRHDGKRHSFTWTNETAIDLSGLPSVHRILVIRDITKRLILRDEQTDEDSKMLTGIGKTTINFKLEDIEFSLRLNPTDNQPGNAVFAMKIAGISCAKSHVAVEAFDCFGDQGLKGEEIDAIVSRARRTGKQITAEDIIMDSREDEVKRQMAEEMNYFMLLYDFEVARRLQRPFIELSKNDSQGYDSLPIGIGIAMIHHINKCKNDKWEFFSGLFLHRWQSRKSVLDEIVEAFNRCMERDEYGTGTENRNKKLLSEQFGSQE